MPVDCQRSTSGGKGNIGRFTERDSRICAAGLPSAQPDESVADAFKQYLLQDEVDALKSDVIFPPKPPRPLPPLRRPIPRDQRNAGVFGKLSSLVNPPQKSKFQSIADDLKDTPYSSYWKKPLGQGVDPIPMFPEGYDIHGTTYGKKTPFHGTLYDIVMPKDTLDNVPKSKQHGVQTRRNYCEPAFNSNLTYGYKSNIDKRGRNAKCCLTDADVIQGTASRAVVSYIQANYNAVKKSRLGTVLAPNDNISEVPTDYSFGILKPPDNLPECLSFCELNPGRDKFKKCLAHLNSLRKVLTKRFLPSFYRTFYLNLKYYDKEKSAWLPKKIVYDYCGSKLIRFDPAFIEPLLSVWNAFDGERIEYKTFVHILNYKEPLPSLPKIPDLPPECLDFRTTYSEMVKPGQEVDKSFMAGVPSGRYLDKDFPVTPQYYCKADRIYLSHESDMKCCICPSILTQLGVSHRDMYERRKPHIVRRVFEATGEKFTDERFNAIWQEAEKYHSQGWVCYETFRRAMENHPVSQN